MSSDTAAMAVSAGRGMMAATTTRTAVCLDGTTCCVLGDKHIPAVRELCCSACQLQLFFNIRKGGGHLFYIHDQPSDQWRL